MYYIKLFKRSPHPPLSLSGITNRRLSASHENKLVQMSQFDRCGGKLLPRRGCEEAASLCAVQRSAARRSPCLHTGDGSSVRPPARPQTCFHLNAMQFHRGTSFFFSFLFQHTHSFLKTRRGRGKRRVVRGGGG